MRVLYFSRAYTTHDRRFLTALAASEHDIWFLRLEDDRVRYESRPVPEPVRVLEPLGGGAPVERPEDWIRLAPKLEAVLALSSPDLVHAGPIQSCAFLTALVGFRPLLSASWGSDILIDGHRDAFWEWMTRFTLDRSDMVLTDCAEVSSATGLPGEKIVQFPWGVDLARFQPPAPADARPAGGTTAISTRSWEPNYGVLHLLEGFARAHSVQPGLRLLLLGDGSQRPQIEQFIREHRLESAVLRCGAVDQSKLPGYFRSADFYVSCALGDGSSLSLLEAMATGLPAIVTDRASNREWIVPGVNGALTSFGNVDAIASALLEMSALSPERRRQIAAANRAVVEERADWNANVRKLVAAYRHLVPPGKVRSHRGEEVSVEVS